MNAKTKKPYVAPTLIEYGDLGTLIRVSQTGIGKNDGKATMKGQFKTG